MAKRKNGEGNYGEKTIKGYKYKYYRDAEGVFTYAKTAKELQEKLKKKKQVQKLTAPRGNLTTFSEVCDEWLLTTLGKLSPGTYDSYENTIKCRIKDYTDYDIGNKQAKGLTVDMLNDYFSCLSEKYSKGSIDKTWAVVRQVLKYGISEEKIPQLNFEKLVRPKEIDCAVKKKEVPFIMLDDMEKLYSEAIRLNGSGNRVYGNAADMLIFIMYSGLRIGEAIGLLWKYVDKDFSNIRVVQSNRTVVVRDKEGHAVLNDKGTLTYKNIQKEPKTEKGIRAVPLPDRAKNILRTLAEKPHSLEDNVFLNSKGNVMDKRNVERTLTKILHNSDCDCKDYTPHSLRHGYGSVLISKGVDIKIVSELLGHSDVAFTYNVYIGILQEDKIKAVNDVFNARN